MTDLVVANLSRAYGSFKAINDVSFRIKRQSFVTLLGPSGCGKSTILWSLAGLDRPTNGRILFGDELIVDTSKNYFVSPEKRGFGLVFQSYAVWPHMTARKNLEYPLKLRKVHRAEIARRVEEIAALVELEGQLDKYPFQLSGGQQQRVALARTLIYRPRLLLLDEPLSNLDAKLRTRARAWLKQLHRRLGVTTIYVTHDQQEALAMSDEILVMDRGHVVQRGCPEDIYSNPGTNFVADFIGNSNLLDALVVDREQARVMLRGSDTSIETVSIDLPNGTPVQVALRPEAISFEKPQVLRDYNRLVGRVQTVSYIGTAYEIVTRIGQMTCLALSRARPSEDEVAMYVRKSDCRVFQRDQAGER